MTERLANGPELWSQILDVMPAGAVVAGGAVRDYLLGVEPKDIDVFMGVPPLPEPEPEPAPTNTLSGGIFVDNPVLVEAPDPRSGLYRIDNIHERQEEYAALTNIELVSSGTLLGWRVDAVVLTDFAGGDALVEGFDFGITRSWFSRERGLVDTAIAFDDRSQRRVTLMLTDRVVRSRQRFIRFNQRMGSTFMLTERGDRPLNTCRYANCRATRPDLVGGCEALSCGVD